MRRTLRPILTIGLGLSLALLSAALNCHQSPLLMRRLLSDSAVHLISLVAPGGMGKTQLARQAGTACP